MASVLTRISSSNSALSRLGSSKSYDRIKVAAEPDHAETFTTRQKRNRRILVAGLAAVLVVVGVIGVVIGVTIKKSGHSDKNWQSSVKRACSLTLYPDVCLSSVSGYPGVSNNREQIMEIASVAVKVALNAVANTSVRKIDILTTISHLDHRERIALEDCGELFEETLDQLNQSLSALNSLDLKTVANHGSDLQTWLSSALTNLDTCLDGFQYSKGFLQNFLQARLSNVGQLVSNSLALVKNICEEGNLGQGSSHKRRLLSDQEGYQSAPDQQIVDGFPTWVSEGDRRLLLGTQSTIKVNAIVAKDGSGNYKNITEAIAAAPNYLNIGDTRYVIYVKAGVYEENVEVPKKKTNLMLVGDGIDVTVITGNKNVIDGSTTYRSATFAATGNGFLARDITFVNSAGPAKHQAVAARVSSDFSAFFRCSFKGYQDTLYARTSRQFFRQCNIYGTVDFIFGNAAVLLQNCNLLVRRPLAIQKNTVTAQGRADPNQNTGISIRNCRITANRDLLPVVKAFPSYLGRPWKQYARTVVMQSYIDSVIVPAGWLEWDGNFALDTLYYAEYMNTGPGASTANRVKWRGYRVIRSWFEAEKFTAIRFIDANLWLLSANLALGSRLA